MAFLKFLNRKSDDLHLPPPPPPLKDSYSELPIFNNEKMASLPSLDSLESLDFRQPQPMQPVQQTPQAPQLPVLEPTKAAPVEQELFMSTSKIAEIQTKVDTALQWAKIPENEALQQEEDQQFSQLHLSLEIIRKKLSAVDIMIFEQR